MEHASAANDSGSDDERHAHLLVLLAAAKRGRREWQRAVLTVATWRVVLRSFPDGDELEDEGLGGPPVKRTRRVLPRPDYRDSFWWRMLGETSLKEPASR
ncbi:unnamed protein product [Ectocarpus sp. CCAP 1310/34]|nr:unnamed protein product [Ectocarpus sp. CCAP 1310/34]